MSTSPLLSSSRETSELEIHEPSVSNSLSHLVSPSASFESLRTTSTSTRSIIGQQQQQRQQIYDGSSFVHSIQRKLNQFINKINNNNRDNFLSIYKASSVWKSVAAYSIATLATLIEPLNDQLGNVSYLVAVAILFFHPARTLGAMVEAFICCIIGLTIGFANAKMCLVVIDFYYKEERNIVEAHVAGLVLLWFTTLVTSFLRARYISTRPAIATATTLVHVLLFVTITQMANEKADDFLPSKLDRITIALFTGTCISCFCCYFIKPQSAAVLLRKDISRVIASIDTFLDTLASSALLHKDSQEQHEYEPHDDDLFASSRLPSPGYSSASTNHKGINLNQSSNSLNNIPSTTSHNTYNNRFYHTLPQISSAFSISSNLVLHLEKMKREVQFEPWSTVFGHYSVFSSIADCVSKMVGGLSALSLSTENLCELLISLDDNNSNKKGKSIAAPTSSFTKPLNQHNHQPKPSSGVKSEKPIKQILDKIQPHTVEMVHAMRHVLETLRIIFLAASIPLETLTLGLVSMEDKCVIIKRESAELKKLLIDEIEHEQIHVLVQFIAALNHISEELEELVKWTHELKIQVDVRRAMGRLKWMFSSLRRKINTNKNSSNRTRSTLSSSSSQNSPYVLSSDSPIAQENDVALSVKIWQKLSLLAQFEYKFAFKTATTIAMMAVPAFVENFQDSFYEYRLNWAMTSAIVVMTPSVGGSNMQGIYRVLGTLAGMSVSVIVWYLSKANPIHLFWMTSFLIAVPGFYLFLHGKYTKIGQIFLLTYSVIIFNKYAAPVDPISGKEYSIVGVAMRRGFAVMMGVVIGLFVSWYIWPFKARDALRKGYSDILMKIGKHYCKSLESLCILPSQPEAVPNEPSELELALPKLHIYVDQTLLEPRWKGAFPYAPYKDLLGITSHMLQHLSLLSSTLSWIHPHVVINSNHHQSDDVLSVKVIPSSVQSTFPGISTATSIPSPIMTNMVVPHDLRLKCQTIIEFIFLIFWIFAKGHGKKYPPRIQNPQHLYTQLLMEWQNFTNSPSSSSFSSTSSFPKHNNDIHFNGSINDKNTSQSVNLQPLFKMCLMHLRGTKGFIDDFERVNSKLVAICGRYDFKDDFDLN